MSEGYSLADRAVILSAAQPFCGDHVNRSSDQFGHFVKETTKGEDRPPRLDLDEEVNVAVGPGVAPGDGAEHADMPNASPASNGIDLRFEPPKFLQGHLAVILTPQPRPRRQDRRTATPMANHGIRRHSATLGEFESQILNGRRRSVNRKVQGSSPCPGAKLRIQRCRAMLYSLSWLAATVQQTDGRICLQCGRDTTDSYSTATVLHRKEAGRAVQNRKVAAITQP